MNPHIEKINKHLFGVRFSWIRAGWVKEFPFINDTGNQHAVVTHKGEIILNKDDPELYDLMRLTLVKRVMPRSDKAITDQISTMETLKTSPSWDNYAEVLLFLLKLEQVRRNMRRR